MCAEIMIAVTTRLRPETIAIEFDRAPRRVSRDATGSGWKTARHDEDDEARSWIVEMVPSTESVTGGEFHSVSTAAAAGLDGRSVSWGRQWLR